MSDHDKDQLCARIEELEKEKLELNEQLDIAQRERDALAAHLERIQSVERDETEYGRNVMDILDYAPATSLARMKAQWQRDLVAQLAEEFRQAWPEHTGKHAWILGAGDSICRQAEGGEV